MQLRCWFGPNFSRFKKEISQYIGTFLVADLNDTHVLKRRRNTLVIDKADAEGAWRELIRKNISQLRILPQISSQKQGIEVWGSRFGVCLHLWDVSSFVSFKKKCVPTARTRKARVLSFTFSSTNKCAAAKWYLPSLQIFFYGKTSE